MNIHQINFITVTAFEEVFTTIDTKGIMQKFFWPKDMRLHENKHTKVQTKLDMIGPVLENIDPQSFLYWFLCAQSAV